jgi:hypothetical protein
MIVERSAEGDFVLVFESDESLRKEHEQNLVHGALRLPVTEPIPLHKELRVTLRGPRGAEATFHCTVVAALADGLALVVEGYGDAALAALTAKPEDREAGPEAEDTAPSAEDGPDRKQTSWDRVRGLTQMEKLLLAVKADRAERSMLLQENDPRVLLSLLRNPRITVDEVARMSRSHFVTYQVVDAIMKAAQWMANLDVRVGIVNNPKTPQAFALRILPTLPDAEVRTIARAGTSMALKQAAMRRLQGK